MAGSFGARVSSFLRSLPQRNKQTLLSILSGKTSISSSGYPYISEASFRVFLREVPHLFQHGNVLLKWLAQAEEKLDRVKDFSELEVEWMRRAVRVLRNIVNSASICAPSDLWIVKHVLSAHCGAGVTEFFRTGGSADPETLARRLHLDARHLSWDLSLLHTRGYLGFRNGRYAPASNPQAEDVIRHAGEIPSEFLRDMVDPIVTALSTKRVSPETNLVRRFLLLPRYRQRREGWFASHLELETGYRLVPVVLAFHVLKISRDVSRGTLLSEFLPRLTPELRFLLRVAGMIEADTALTALAVRVLNRGPGPFGIIHAYFPYMRVLQDKLRGTGTTTSVQRAKNIAASQDANRKTFEMANDCLDHFCNDYPFQYKVFIEHALGLGEATRQRLQRSGEEDIRYFGADLEDAAIDRALALQQQGILPKNMNFVRRADIANPQIVIDAVRRAGSSTEGAVMVVGNGFHEIRGQTNEKVVDIFRGYCSAGILLVFTEESALSDPDLLATGWNTYHAGFRYVHELSGQGLRPAAGTDRFGRHSWKICASLGGYAVLQKYSARTRTIYPFPRKGGYNPPISMTYFCIPAKLATALGIYPTGWGAAGHR